MVCCNWRWNCGSLPFTHVNTDYVSSSLPTTAYGLPMSTGWSIGRQGDLSNGPMCPFKRLLSVTTMSDRLIFAANWLNFARKSASSRWSCVPVVERVVAGLISSRTWLCSSRSRSTDWTSANNMWSKIRLPKIHLTKPHLSNAYHVRLHMTRPLWC